MVEASTDTLSQAREALAPYSKAAESLVPGSIYEHYRGNTYKVLAVGRNSETLEEVVIYQDLNGNHDVWSRPLPMFVENIEINGNAVPRFKLISGSAQ